MMQYFSNVTLQYKIIVMLFYGKYLQQQKTVCGDNLVVRSILVKIYGNALS